MMTMGRIPAICPGDHASGVGGGEPELRRPLRLSCASSARGVILRDLRAFLVSHPNLPPSLKVTLVYHTR